MTPEMSEWRFAEILAQAGDELSKTPSEEGIRLMLDFYRDERAEGCSIEEDGDILLYQWGCCDWGEGEWFGVSITRQFIPGGGEDEEILQLTLAFRRQPTAALRELRDGNRWCSSLAELDEFRAFILTSPAFRAIVPPPAAEVTLKLGIAG